MDITLILQGLDCANCAEKIRSRVENLQEVEKAEMNFMAKKLKIKAKEKTSEKDIVANVKGIVSEIEPDVTVNYEENDEGEESNPLKSDLIKIIIGAVIFAASVIIPMNSWVKLGLLVVSYLIIGGEVLLRAVKNIIKGKVFDENFLMALATVGAFTIKQYPEAVAVMLFYQVGELFQSYAVNRSRKSISELMDIRPDYANLQVGNEVKTVSPNDIKVGDVIIVKAGERVALDGKVIRGNSMLDTSSLTGESVPRAVEVGNDVISGCINLNGLLEIEVTKSFGESTVTKILDLVENASSKKAETENFITRFARWYTPAVVIVAALLAVIPPLFFGMELRTWVYRALSFLVVSCPCALVISIPLSFFGGIGGASKCGILVKGSNYLEALSKCKTVVFDKTGTLTKGIFEVTEIMPVDISSERLLEVAAYAEHFSNHPIANSIKRAYKKEINAENVYAEEISGKGVKATIGENIVLAGNVRLMEAFNIIPNEVENGTVVHVAINNKYAGYILISDVIKADAKDAISGLKTEGIRKTVMLTGDSKKVAENVSVSIDIDQYFAELLPNDKVDKLEELLKELSDGEMLAFVGDGINDAPVLARADIGIAMGGLGSDAAIEAADIVIMTDEPSKISTAMKISKKTIRIVKENIIFALGIKFAVLILVALGIATMWAAVFADVGVAFIAILNAIRCLNVKKFR